jgi:flagellar motor protein MotB
MAPEIPGYSEVRDFNQRMAQKMGTIFSGAMSPAMLSAQPGMSAGMADMVKEMSKLAGVPVSQIMRMGSTTDGSPLPAASEAPLPQSNGPTAGSAANQAASNAANSTANTASSNAESSAASHMGGFGSTLGSLGGLGGFHKKKPQDQQQQQQQPAAPQNWMVLIESSTEMTNFSSASVDPALFNVPAGYSKIASAYQKGQQ